MRIDSEGMTIADPGATPGLKLFSPVQSKVALLIDERGHEVHRWNVHGQCTNWCELRPNGNLLMNEAGSIPGPVPFGAGLMREYSPDGSVVWEHEDTNQHHDFRRLDDGRTVYLAWTKMDDTQASAIDGGLPGTEINGAIFSEAIIEIDESGNKVWEWHLTDYANWPFHPNAVRRNYGHANAIHPLPNGDYLLSFKVLNLLLIVSRQTGEVVWEFQDDALGGQHDAQMTKDGTILVFANGTYSPDLIHSQVWEIDRESKDIIWRYTEKQNPLNFYSTHISGAQRLPSGNTLICEGAKGCLMEVTPDCDVIWQYVNPHWQPHPKFTNINWIYRARHYMPDAPEVAPYI